MVAAPRTSRRLLVVIAVVVGAIAVISCDTGGLLIVEKKPPVVGPVVGHSANEFVSGGKYAQNGQYKLFFVLGQPTPNQGVARTADQRLNGGLVGAVNGNP